MIKLSFRPRTINPEHQKTSAGKSDQKKSGLKLSRVKRVFTGMFGRTKSPKASQANSMREATIRTSPLSNIDSNRSDTIDQLIRENQNSWDLEPYDACEDQGDLMSYCGSETSSNDELSYAYSDPLFHEESQDGSILGAPSQRSNSGSSSDSVNSNELSLFTTISEKAEPAQKSLPDALQNSLSKDSVGVNDDHPTTHLSFITQLPPLYNEEQAIKDLFTSDQPTRLMQEIGDINKEITTRYSKIQNALAKGKYQTSTGRSSKLLGVIAENIQSLKYQYRLAKMDLAKYSDERRFSHYGLIEKIQSCIEDHEHLANQVNKNLGQMLKESRPTSSKVIPDTPPTETEETTLKNRDKSIDSDNISMDRDNHSETQASFSEQEYDLSISNIFEMSSVEELLVFEDTSTQSPLSAPLPSPDPITIDASFTQPTIAVDQTKLAPLALEQQEKTGRATLIDKVMDEVLDVTTEEIAEDKKSNNKTRFVHFKMIADRKETGSVASDQSFLLSLGGDGDHCHEDFSVASMDHTDTTSIASDEPKGSKDSKNKENINSTITFQDPHYDTMRAHFEKHLDFCHRNTNQLEIMKSRFASKFDQTNFSTREIEARSEILKYNAFLRSWDNPKYFEHLSPESFGELIKSHSKHASACKTMLLNLNQHIALAKKSSNETNQAQWSSFSNELTGGYQDYVDGILGRKVIQTAKNIVSSEESRETFGQFYGSAKVPDSMLPGHASSLLKRFSPGVIKTMEQNDALNKALDSLTQCSHQLIDILEHNKGADDITQLKLLDIDNVCQTINKELETLKYTKAYYDSGKRTDFTNAQCLKIMFLTKTTYALKYLCMRESMEIRNRFRDEIIAQ